MTLAPNWDFGDTPEHRRLTPDNLPGLSDGERALLRTLVEASNVQYLHGLSTRGYPCPASRVTDAMRRDADVYDRAGREFQARHGLTWHDFLLGHDAVTRHHPLHLRLLNAKWGRPDPDHP